MEFAKFIEWAFYAIVSGSVMYGVAVLGKLHTDLKELSNQFARILEKLTWHERWLERHDTEIDIHINRKY